MIGLSEFSGGAPSIATVPAVGRKRPPMIDRSVLLPQPDGPDDDRDLVAGDLERDVVEDGRPAEVVAHPFDEEAHRQPSGGTNEVSTMSFTPKPLSTMPFDW